MAPFSSWMSENQEPPITRYVCVTCGAPSDSLYKQLSCDVLTLLQCSLCGHAIDEYIEYDPPLIAIDIVLQRHQAYRHVLFNAGPKPFWKLAIILLLCDTYALWTQRRPKIEGGNLFEYKFPIQPEWDFYTMSAVAIVEAVLFGAIVLAGVDLVLKRQSTGQKRLFGSVDLMRALIVGGCGKVLAVPASIWGIQGSLLYVGLATLFVAVSQVHVLEAVTRLPRIVVIVIVASGLAVQYGFRTLALSVL